MRGILLDVIRWRTNTIKKGIDRGEIVRMNKVTPFLKWAGGKRWFAEKHLNVIPCDYSDYIEPFLGSGAVFFTLSPEKGCLSDVNEELIHLYQTIKYFPTELYECLSKHHEKHSKEYYYKIRSMTFIDPVPRAARMLYLNRACWNGLYRVNLQGEFNVPIGTKKNVLLDTDDFDSTSALLQNFEIRCCDFSESIKKAKPKDLIFVDPPYTVKHNKNGFVKYNEHIFSWNDQKRLAQCLRDAISRGAYVMMTNAAHESVIALYRDIGEISKLSRPSVLAANTDARTRIDEMMLISWM